MRHALNRGALPTFIVIGAMKSGTVSFHNYLRTHPEIGMSRPKETNFFTNPDHNGHDLRWYRKQFFGRGPQFGESTTWYTKRHQRDGVAERMHVLLPNLRLIYLVRDPVDRAVTHFLHDLDKGRVRAEDFDAVFADPTSTYFETSRYAFQLDPYLDTYGRDRILVITSEDLRDQRVVTLQRVFAFLGVDASFTSPTFDVVHHRTLNKASLDAELVGRLQLSPGQRRFVTDTLQDDIDRFRTIVGDDFARWSV